MTKLTKEQVKFFIETMTDDIHNTTQHKIAETLLSKFGECESLQAKLLAYEQAAKNPVAWTDSDELEDARKGYSAYLFAIDGEANKFSDPRRKIMLYTAPILPKQQSIKLPTTRLWAGVIECYEKNEIIAAIKSAGYEVSND